MAFLADLVVRDRPELTLTGGGRIVAELVTAALGARLEVPAPLTAPAPALGPAELTWLRATAADLTHLGSRVDGLDRLTTFLDGAGGAPVDVVAPDVTFEAWLSGAFAYYRGLGFFAGDAAPDLPALRAAWEALGPAPGEALARGGEHLPDATLLRADRARVVDGEQGTAPFSDACRRAFYELAALARGRAELALRGCAAHPDPRPRPPEARALFGEDLVELRLTIDGEPASVALPYLGPGAFFLAPLLAVLDEALAPRGLGWGILRAPTVVVLLPLEDLDRLRRERGVALWRPAALAG